MPKSTEPSYPRAPSDRLRELLTGDGFLAPLAELSKRQVGGCQLDVHFRSGDEIDVYRGSARLINAKRLMNDGVKFDADRKYRRGGYEGHLFRKWGADEAGLEIALNEYMEHVSASGLRVVAEARVQDSWSRLTSPWISIDREVAFEGGIHGQIRPQVKKAFQVVADIACRLNRNGDTWKTPTMPTGKQLDRLGVDEQGHLVLAELKHASSTNYSSIFYAPLQLLAYIHEWHVALSHEHIVQQLQKLISARTFLERSAKFASLTGHIRPAICFGVDERSKEVKRRYYEVLGVANAHLPNNVRPIETWMIGGDGKPQSL